MKPNIVFIVMSAVHSPAVVSQLARSLAPHTVLVHHDFSQTPDFPLDAPNARFVPNPKRTGWDVWGFTEGIVAAMQHAIDTESFDYLQILSPTCLPIKPIAALEAHVASNRTDADFSCVDVLGDADALMTIGYRAFSPRNTLRHLILRRLSLWYFEDPRRRLDIAGIQLRTGAARNTRGDLSWVARMSLAAIKASSYPTIGRHTFRRTLQPYYGSTWFGARRPVIQWLLKRIQDDDIQKQFPSMVIADEFLFASLLMQGGFRKGESNHFIAGFVEANPLWIGENEMPRLRTTPAFFARKFPDDASAPIRRQVLSELVQAPALVAAAAPAGLQHEQYHLTNAG